ncbi:MAG: hypothetical protein J6Q14_08275 [Oscillospiraceae bacterium]|nr:hypothetical protein [Oscillospiraceae bacterium]
MNKSVLISIRPRWIDLIARGEKTIEVRKSRPKLDPPFKCYIYCTKAQNPVLVALQNLEGSPVIMTCGAGSRRYPVEDATWARLLNGTVCGEFTCDEIVPIVVFDIGSIQYWNAYSLKEACMTYDQMADYIGYGKQGFGWHISKLKIYDEPKELSEFTKPCPKGHDCATCSWYFPGIQDYGRCEPPCCGFWESDDSMIARPPQSWCYVEGD